MNRDNIQLTEEELEIEKNLEEYAPVKDLDAEVAKITQAFKNTRKRISLRVPIGDLERIKEKAAQRGLPYQTLINSILHQFAAGNLAEKYPV